MDDYLMDSLFAAKLLEYMFEKMDYPWDSPYINIFGNDCPKSRFDENIGEAVCTILSENCNDVTACNTELSKAGVHDKETFGKYALSAANSYFKEGYDPGSFLGYCAIVLGTATHYFAYPSNGVPEMAVEVIALVLFAHQLTGQFNKHDGWDGLVKTSQLFNAVCK